MNDTNDFVGNEASIQPLIKNTDTSSFPKDVLEASKDIPILVDFWAEWCGPCKQLGPTLESVVKSYEGKIKLVKIDIDKNKELAQQLKIQSVPTVYAFFQGQPIDGFSGALPENEVKEFVNKVITSSGGEDKEKQVEEYIQAAEKKLASKDFDEALNLFSKLLSVEENNPRIVAGYGKCLINLGRPEEAEELINSLEDEVLSNNSIQNLVTSLKLLKENKNAGSPDEFEKKIANNPNDLKARFSLANALLAIEKKNEAVEHLLEIVKIDKKWQDDKARKKIIEILNANEEDDLFASEVRLKLSNILFS